MLILAGVSLNAMVGDNGIITMAQLSSLESRFANYKEEMEMNLVTQVGDEKIESESQVTVLSENVRQYIPSLVDEDIGQFGIIAGQLYYIGDNEISIKAARSQNIAVMPSDKKLDDFVNEVESLALEQTLLTMAGDAFKQVEIDEDGNEVESEIGIKLMNKVGGTFGSTQNWKIITEVQDGEVVATYAANWYYVEAGTEIPNLGVLKNSYIINYKDKKAVKFNPMIHSIVANGSNVAVTEGLVFNADPTNMSGGDSTSWGNAILHGFSGTEYNEDGTVKSGWTKDAFITDGIDDYVEIPSDNINSINGFTIEFYGRMLGSNSNYYMFSKASSSGSVSTLGYWSYTNTIWYGGSHRHWNLNENPVVGKDIYISLCYPNEVFGSYTLGEVTNSYYPGKETNLSGNDALEVTKGSNSGCGFGNVRAYNNLNLLKPKVDREIWDGYNTYVNFITSDAPFYFGLGNGNNYSAGASGCSPLKIYAIRVYNRELSYNECVANYNATVTYRNILNNNGNASTGGNTEGTDLEHVEVNP